MVATMVVCAGLVAAVELLLHYLPRLFMAGDMQPPWTYVAGLLPIVTVGWLFEAAVDAPRWMVSASWTLCIVAGGVAVIGAYKVDALVAQLRRSRREPQDD